MFHSHEFETAVKKIDCFKCGGNGNIAAFSHIAGGRCFQCGGSGDLAKVKTTAKRETKAAKALRIAKQEIVFQETILAHLIADDGKREYESEEEAFGPTRDIINQEAYVTVLKERTRYLQSTKPYIPYRIPGEAERAK